MVSLVDVEQHEVGPRLPGHAHAFAGGFGFGGGELLVQLQLFGQRAAQLRVVVDDQDGLALRHGTEDALD